MAYYIYFCVLTKNIKMLYSIYAESTPNPKVMKFVCNKILTTESIQIKSKNNKHEIELINKLFDFPFVKEIYVNSNFISITKTDNIEWESIAIQLRSFISDFLNNNDFSIKTSTQNNNKSIKKVKSKYEKKESSDIENQIKSILNQYIKPAVELDGGEISLASYKNNIVKVELKGACNGCPSSTVTLKNGIENLLRQKINPDIEVIAV
ncbi:MAG: hypothetical protein CMP69_03710 [Flavobacteriales bacterium]|nr:hypothetical protein [Flavobacteriales bacterium]